MRWYQGTINEAVTASKTKRAIFVVFVEGQDASSKEMSKMLESKSVSNQLEQEHFVAIKLESGSESYKFFVQIYQLVPVPSLFFIGENGLPIEVVADAVTTDSLSTKIQEILSKSGKILDPSIDFIRAEQASSEFEASRSDSHSRLELEAAGTVASSSNVSPKQLEASSSKEDKPQELTIEEKLERAKLLIELQEQKRIEEEKQKEKERELERRKTGKDVLKMKQKQQELEIKQAYEERMKEKAEEAAAREKVRQQIEQDRLERKQKNLSLQQQQQSAEQKEAAPSPRAPVDEQFSDTTRIQFKLPSGATHAAQFDSTASLALLRDYVTANIQLPFRRFSMSTSYPRRDLTAEDAEKTLIDLELVPRSVILILPQNTGSSAVTRARDNFLSQMFWTILAPVFSAYNYISGWFFGQRPGPAGTGRNDDGGTGGRRNSESHASSSYGRNASQSGERLSGNIGARTVRAQGNIHRLHSDRDDNDENNTWNGNSTQQM